MCVCLCVYKTLPKRCCSKFITTASLCERAPQSTDNPQMFTHSRTLAVYMMDSAARNYNRTRKKNYICAAQMMRELGIYVVVWWGYWGAAYMCTVYMFVCICSSSTIHHLYSPNSLCLYIYIYVIISQAHTSAITGLCALKKNPTTDEIHKTKNRSNINSKVLCGIARPRRRWKNREEDETP